MTTLIIDVKNSNDARKIADALRLMKGVTRISVEEDACECISGIAYTKEERIAAIHRSEEEIVAGKIYTAEEVRKRYSLQ